MFWSELKPSGGHSERSHGIDLEPGKNEVRLHASHHIDFSSRSWRGSTLDQLAGGNRAICGLGVSGPQIVEGWYGQPWGRPYYRLKDYVAIMKKIFAREEPVTHEGKEIGLPYAGDGAMGVGKPLKSILHMNPDIPIFLGTGMESTVRLTAEIADDVPAVVRPATARMTTDCRTSVIKPARTA